MKAAGTRPHHPAFHARGERTTYVTTRHPSASVLALFLGASFLLGACSSNESDGDSDSSTSTIADDDLETEPSVTNDTNDAESEPGNTNDANGSSTASDDGEPPVGELPEDDTDEINFGGGADISGSVGNDPDEGESTENVSEDEPAEPLVSCSAAVGTGDAPTIDDFEDADQTLLTQDGRDAGWYWYNSAEDEEQGFIIEVSDDFPSGGTHAMHTWGSAYDWAGIGAGLRWSAPDEDDIWQDCLYDASVYEGVRFWARGNGESVRFSISVPGVIPVEEGGTCDGGCWNNHGVDVVIGEEWQEYFLGFDEMLQKDGDLGPIDPRELRTFQFEFPYGGDFDLWLDEIAFFSAGDAPSDVPTETSDDTEDDTSMDDTEPTDDPSEDDAADDTFTDDDASGDDTSSSEADAGAPDPAVDGGN